MDRAVLVEQEPLERPPQLSKATQFQTILHEGNSQRPLGVQVLLRVAQILDPISQRPFKMRDEVLQVVWPIHLAPPE